MIFDTQRCRNYISKKIDFQIMADFILRFDPDIVGLNEMCAKGTDLEYEDQVACLFPIEFFLRVMHIFLRLLDFQHTYCHCPCIMVFRKGGFP